MSDMAELERRINAALERIDRGIDALARPAAAPAQPAGDDAREAEIARLQEALESERASNAQLTERVRALREKHEAAIAALERSVARLTAQLDAVGAELQNQKRINAGLIQTNRELSEAMKAGLAEPQLVNRAMMTELEALRAARRAEMAEMEEILSELKPLIEEVA